MSDSEKMNSSVIALIDELLDGRITDQNLRKLEELLRHNAAAQRFLLSYSQLHLDLLLDTKAEQAFQTFRDRQRQGQAVSPLQPQGSTAAPPAGPVGGFGFQVFRGMSTFSLGAFVLLLIALVVASVSFFSAKRDRDLRQLPQTKAQNFPA